MIVKDLSFTSPEENILFDDVLLYRAEKEESGEVLRFWESPVTFIVLGRMSKEEDDLNVNAVLQDRIPVIRRSSGGGTVVQGKGCLNYSLILSKKNATEVVDLRKSYHFIIGKVVQVLDSLGIEANFFPISDIALKSNVRKFSGNAQKRGKNYILHHGTILYDFDLSLIEKYLMIPKDIPEYRRGRPHADFVTNVPLDILKFKIKIKDAFGTSAIETVLLPRETEQLQEFLKLKKVRVDLQEGLLLKS